MTMMVTINTAALLLLPSIAWSFSPPLSSSSSSLFTATTTTRIQQRPTIHFTLQSKSSSINAMPEIFGNFVDCGNYISSLSSSTTSVAPIITPLLLNIDPASSSSSSSGTLLLAFSDQGRNLAGTFFQLSLLPYVLFLFFLGRPHNRTPELGLFGWQYLLLFVLGTIPAGIIAKTVYGTSLADVDWLHGSAEGLLTVTNVLIVLGFREAMIDPDYGNADVVGSSSGSSCAYYEEGDGRQSSLSKYGNMPKIISGMAVLLFATLCTIGTTTLNYDTHTPFLFGIGNLSPTTDIVRNNIHLILSEPNNALSIPTWAIHFSSVFEFLFAMDIIWKFAHTTQNEKWKGLTWGMLPLHASGICACTYHVFYNIPILQFVVELQAFFTLLGNITVMIAAYRIARSNGWSWMEVNPFNNNNNNYDVDTNGEKSSSLITAPSYIVIPSKESELQLGAKLLALTVVSSYVLKYGELILGIPSLVSTAVTTATENNNVAIIIVSASAIVFVIPAITAYLYYKRGLEEGGEGIKLFSFGGSDSSSGSVSDDNDNSNSEDDTNNNRGLSMVDIKKFGISGTVAYVITELVFWAVAFPVASTTLYRTTGHWPDVVNDMSDRGAVLAFIFAGANVARLLVPLRLGAALALAPWVDENIINREGG